MVMVVVYQSALLLAAAVGALFVWMVTRPDVYRHRFLLSCILSVALASTSILLGFVFHALMRR